MTRNGEMQLAVDIPQVCGKLKRVNEPQPEEPHSRPENASMDQVLAGTNIRFSLTGAILVDDNQSRAREGSACSRMVRSIVLSSLPMSLK